MKVIAKLFMLLGALFFSQMPLFISAYTQQLYGRVAELKLQKEALVKIAQQSGKTLDQYIFKFLSSTDPDFHGQGEWMQMSVNRLHSLQEALQSLYLAQSWERPFVFFKTLNFDIAQAALSHFTVGLPLNVEGAAYAAAGAGFGWFLFYCLRQLLRSLAAPFKRKHVAQDP